MALADKDYATSRGGIAVAVGMVMGEWGERVEWREEDRSVYLEEGT